MSKEYIEREPLQKLFNEVSTSLLCKKELVKDTEHMVRAFLMVTEMIQDAPAADVAPVRHGVWEYEPPTINTYGMLKCSKCGWWTLDQSVCDVYHFCPNCGCKMDLEG